MGLYRPDSEIEHPATKTDLSFCRSLPTAKDCGIPRDTYLELVANPSENLLAMGEIIDIYEVALFNEELIDDIIGAIPDNTNVDPGIKAWFDHDLLHEFVIKSFNLITGEVNEENLHAASVLVCAWYAVTNMNIDHNVAVIKDMDHALKKVRLEIRRLSVDKNEPETKEELDMLITNMELMHDNKNNSYNRIQEEKENLKLALQAARFISSQILL